MISIRKGLTKMEEELLFVINIIDFAYEKPLVKVAYAGSNMSRAYSVYHKCVGESDRTQVNLELVQGDNVQRLETHLYK